MGTPCSQTEGSASGCAAGASAMTEKARMTAQIRQFHLVRDEDVSGVSGVGNVAVGVVLPTGRCVLEWLDTTAKGVRSIGIYESISEVETIHGHNGSTRIEYAAARASEGHGRIKALEAALRDIEDWCNKASQYIDEPGSVVLALGYIKGICERNKVL